MKKYISISNKLILLTPIAFMLLGANAWSANASKNKLNFLIISDSHVDIKNKNPVNINPTKGAKGSDLDLNSFYTLVEKMSEAVTQIPEKPDFAMILGDLPSHNAGKYRSEALKLSMQTYYDRLSPMPMFYSFGNNDSPVANYGAFTNTTDESPYTFGNEITGGKGGFLYTGKQCPFKNEPCLNNGNKKFGFYSATVGEGLKLLSLNSVLYVDRPGFNVSREGDEIQFQWIEQELQAAKKNGEQIIMSMHVPPSDWLDNYHDQLENLLNKYPKQVISMFVAHAHTNGFRLLKLENGDTIPYIYSVGLSSSHGNSAGFKTVTMKRNKKNSWAIQNLAVYRFDNPMAEQAAVKLFYDFNMSYCPDTNVEFFNDCLGKNISQRGRVSKRASELLKQHYYVSPDFAKSSAVGVMDDSSSRHKKPKETDLADLKPVVPDNSGHDKPHHDRKPGHHGKKPHGHSGHSGSKPDGKPSHSDGKKPGGNSGHADGKKPGGNSGHHGKNDSKNKPSNSHGGNKKPAKKPASGFDKFVKDAKKFFGI